MIGGTETEPEIWETMNVGYRGGAGNSITGVGSGLQESVWINSAPPYADQSVPGVPTGRKFGHTTYQVTEKINSEVLLSEICSDFSERSWKRVKLLFLFPQK